MPRDPPVTNAMRPFMSGMPVMIWSLQARGESTPVQRRQSLRRRDIVHGVGVEERIELIYWPFHGGETIARGPAVDLPDVFDHQRAAKLFAQCDGPYSDHRVRLAVGGRDR